MRDLSNYAFRFLKRISFPRLTGSPEEKRARDIIEEELGKLNIPISEHPFPIWTFNPGEGALYLDGRKIPAVPYGNTKPFEMDGELYYLEDVDFAGKEVKGKIVLTYEGIRGSKYEKLLEKGVKGLIKISEPEKEFQFSSISQRFVEEDKVIPALIVDYESGLLLLNHVGKRVKMVGSTSYFKGEGVNIVAEIRGSDLEDEVVVICGHYDSVAISPGATDNAGGSSIMMALARYFSKVKPRRTFRFIWFSGEELGLVGSQAYVESIKDEIKRVKLVLNLDVAGDPIGENRAHVISEKDLQFYFSAFAKELGIPCKVNLSIYSSDSMPFSLYGVPSLNLFRAGGKGSFFIHSHYDHKRYTSPQGLKPILDLSLKFLERLSESKVFPFERKISPELKDKIVEYFKRMQGKKVELKWEE